MRARVRWLLNLDYDGFNSTGYLSLWRIYCWYTDGPDSKLVCWLKAIRAWWLVLRAEWRYL